MTAIDQHIYQLLFTHECVIIPQFGAFVATPTSAKIDNEKNIFIPPSKEIGFNRSLIHNDGLLISTFAQENMLSYGHSKINIENYTANLKDELDAGKEVNIEGIGRLKADANGNLQFTASNSDNFCTDSFGLGSFHFAPDIQLKPSNESLQVRRLLKPLTQKHIAATVALLVGLFVISPDVNNEYDANTMNTASTIDFSSSSNNSNQVTYVSEAATFKVEDTAANENTNTTSFNEDQFYIIAGSFKNEQQAQRFLKQIHNIGEEQAFVLHSPNNRFRIALNGFSEKDVAVKSMLNYRKQKDFKTVWVMKQ
ncbi:SPOR domain-containing protein [Carboxylicivirga sp. N1Y90]|uniref:HU domain-containing protein n=1 Tax=Carboxylicivirga fragile TaxID=3417571 RepID=UPI003D337C7B|nr:SPOR domain-containing protein [Marinilabiliaceae bacterium N1Y90]